MTNQDAAECTACGHPMNHHHSEGHCIHGYCPCEQFGAAPLWLAAHDAGVAGDAARQALDGFEERIEYGHQTIEAGWVPEYRGIKYATHARKVMWRAEWPTYIDHWSDPSDDVRIITDRPAARAEQETP